jgi:O-antigen/teichoic acid export membrane protein
MLSMDGLGRKLMRGSGAVLLFKVGGALAGYGFAWQVAAAGGAAAYGRFEWAVTVLMVAAMVGRLGLDGAAVHLIAGWEAQGLRARVAPFFRWGSGVVVAVSGAIGVAMYLALEAPEGWGWGWAGSPFVWRPAGWP